ncbi:MAG: hypothetical protein GY679_01785 [Mycoplasma sp.]|nr:hypothetical protein [Mycoplasma sp.]
MGFIGQIDIDYKEIEKYMEALKKKPYCKAPPSPRFSFKSEGIVFEGLVCKGLGGKSTGVYAETCKKCKKTFRVSEGKEIKEYSSIDEVYNNVTEKIVKVNGKYYIISYQHFMKEIFEATEEELREYNKIKGEV